MVQFYRKLIKKIGMPPGSIVHTGSKKVENVSISQIVFSPKDYLEKKITAIEDISLPAEENTCNWIQVIGLHDPEIVKGIGDLLGIHSLVLEDIVNTEQRPKFEDHEEYRFFVLKELKAVENIIEPDQICLIVKDNTVIAFQENVTQIFDSLIDRIKKKKGRVRSGGIDYFTYTLIDSIIDDYYVNLQEMGEKLGELEENILSGTEKNQLKRINAFQKMILNFRRNVVPVRDILFTMLKEENDFVSEGDRIYYKDLNDHYIQIVELLDSFRDQAVMIFDMHNTVINNKLNEIMKILTVITAFFIPLTFIAGIYGMNFKYMPELEWRYGYPAVIVVFIILVFVMLIFFKKRKWF